MTSLRLSHISAMHADFTSPTFFRACAFGGRESLVSGSESRELTQTTLDYRPDNWTGNGMT